MNKEKEVRDLEYRVYGICRKDNFTEECDGKQDKDITDEEWVNETEHIGIIMTLNTFIDNINNKLKVLCLDNYKYRVIPVGYFNKEVDIVPKNKLHYIIRD
jgi:hypothetical protein